MPKTSKDFIEIFLAQRQFLKGIAYRYAPEKSYLDDILQQVFLEYLKKTKQWDDAFEVMPLLVAMTKNIALRHWREKMKKMPHVLRQIADAVQRKSMENLPSPYEDEIRIMNESITLLSEDHQAMIRMYYFEGVSVQDIAEKLEIKPRNVYSILTRIREALKSAISRKIKEHD